MPDPVDALPPLREVIAHHGLAAQKSLGQHFLLDLNLTRRIARAAGDLTTGTVIEIGPGPGGLTRALLLEGAAHVVAIERDARCIATLASLRDAAGSRLTLIEADARHVDPVELGPPPRRIVANLPYNVGTHLLLGWLAGIEAYASLTLMFQAEVADRLVAAPGSGDYGRLSVAAGWRCRTRRLFDIPARAFTPPPKIDSTVVQFEPYPVPPWPADPQDFERVTAAAFAQRRKMLRGALKALPVDPGTLLARADILPTARAEELSIEDFARLARAFTVLRAGG
ncbi:MAG: 16S rRNA (adenine(1518)-N(6)/adenine(1519)-N(6))-dimethyltransferase RsmA [Alphaproteobacteria bacterium]